MPTPRIYHAIVPERAPFALYALLQRDDDVTDFIPGNVENFDAVFFDLDNGDTEIWTKDAVDPTGILTDRQTGNGVLPGGFNFKMQFGKNALDDDSVPLQLIGGKKYRLEIEFHSNLLDVEGSGAKWDIDVEPKVRA